MENSGSDAGGNRVAALEKKVNGVEALVREFTQELLDLKAITTEMSRQTEECSLQELTCMQRTGAHVPGAVAAGGTAPQPQDSITVSAGSGIRAGDTGPRTRDEPLMDMIMQTDGTMKPEIRRGSRNCIVAPVGYGTSGGGRNKKGIPVRPGQSRLTCAFEEIQSGRPDFA
ncbi:hypothetical protein [Methanoregula sp.]|uniref:hypothetical protein n=1 Tax=Methanoregula sp. TaxID=2052170 RepID=UPI003BAED2AB